MRAVLLVAAVALFLIAAVSAFTVSVNVNEPGFVSLGLAAFAGAGLADGYGHGYGYGVGRRTAPPADRPVRESGTRRSWFDRRI
ncbi:MAG TPA: hypothetical protein VGV63_10870 [Acidimicrobiales bacterium]|nr:hypothetical protein [Acidimicrobiales bacterium]